MLLRIAGKKRKKKRRKFVGNDTIFFILYLSVAYKNEYWMIMIWELQDEKWINEDGV